MLVKGAAGVAFVNDYDDDNDEDDGGVCCGEVAAAVFYIIRWCWNGDVDAEVMLPLLPWLLLMIIAADTAAHLIVVKACMISNHSIQSIRYLIPFITPTAII